MSDRSRLLPLALVLAVVVPSSRADDPPAGGQDPKPRGVAEILRDHDRAKLRDLEAYVREHPDAGDLDQAYLALFEVAVANDWYADTEAAAKQYLAAYPEGAVRPMAQIIATMARAKAGQFAEAWAIYRELVRGLEGIEQEEFATNFADSLASEATAAGEIKVARQVYETLLERFGDSPALRAKVRDDLARLDLVGKPAPVIAVRDVNGKPLRLSDYQGKYVLVDFWATWCAPCLAELPNLQAAYDQFHGRGFEVISVSLDEAPEAVTDFVKARKIPWPQIHNATCGGDVVASYGVNNIPASFLVGPDGTILRLEPRGEALQKALEPLLK